MAWLKTYHHLDSVYCFIFYKGATAIIRLEKRRRRGGGTQIKERLRTTTEGLHDLVIHQVKDTKKLRWRCEGKKKVRGRQKKKWKKFICGLYFERDWANMHSKLTVACSHSDQIRYNCKIQNYLCSWAWKGERGEGVFVCVEAWLRWVVFTCQTLLQKPFFFPCEWK